MNTPADKSDSPAALEGRKHTPVPWHVATNPGGPGDQPAFPSIRDNSGLPHGEDIVAMPLGDSETVKANAAFICEAVNSHALLLAQNAEMREALEQAKPILETICAMIPSEDVIAVRDVVSAALSRNGGKV